MLDFPVFRESGGWVPEESETDIAIDYFQWLSRKRTIGAVYRLNIPLEEKSPAEAGHVVTVMSAFGGNGASPIRPLSVSILF